MNETIGKNNNAKGIVVITIFTDLNKIKCLVKNEKKHKYVRIDCFDVFLSVLKHNEKGCSLEDALRAREICFFSV